MNQDLEFLAGKALWVRRKVLEMAVGAGSGHVSTAYSQTEMLIALYQGGILNVDPGNPRWDERDRFILSKGQGGIGLYPVLADMGFFPQDELDKFAKPGGKLGVHSEWHTPGVEVITGSLGHGLPIATGMCEAALLDGKDHLVFVMLGDGELCEGSNWEAMFTVATKRYPNLIILIDRNHHATIGRIDADDFASDGPTQEPLGDKFRAFGCEVRRIDGHDFGAIFECFNDIRERKNTEWTRRPLVVIADTKKGRGASVMEDKRLWHYRCPSSEDLETTRGELKMSDS